MEFIRKVFLFLFGVILFFLLLLLAITASVDTTVLNPDFLKEKLREQDLTWVVEEVLGNMDLPDLPADQKEKAEKEIALFIKTYIPQVVDDFYAYLDGDMDKISSVIPLKDLKEQIRVLAYEEFKKSSRNPEKEFENYWKDMEKSIPDTIDMGELLNAEKGVKELEQFRKGMADFRSASQGILYAVIAIAVVMLILSWNIQRFLKTTGGILLSLSILLLLLAGVYYLGKGMITSVLENLNEGDMDISWVFEFIGGFFRSILIFGASYMGGGILFLIIGSKKLVSKDSTDEDIE